jgi:hypothetical protein
MVSTVGAGLGSPGISCHFPGREPSLAMPGVQQSYPALTGSREVMLNCAWWGMLML